ncbi:MAG: 3-hydroxyacyl-ACP dehydratase FabZ [Candidatus Woesearchaeota archaeon]|jgi:beta-hydroxyacyl-ACP dehydratase FabZ|nr:3-hydroxyacyl-ACP dehydratase FabZ [Candidatus Woesearchaeota archaeon]MDP7179729.1 3-hydroxyacyl-ACP dehydratase FabZ [Candidatus Woesearchaeota archaeon]MDP7457364.1 3-hydroxyacyl-ACP dehydratase FabZ [Candidatus Woesearchaeota archaeon]
MKSIDEFKDEKGQIDSNGIKQIIPYEAPFLMIDRVTSIEKNKIVAIKNTSANEDFFKGHFAGFPIMPGALIIEGLGQAGTLLVRYNLENHHEKEVLAYKIKEAKFNAPTFPGDQLVYEITLMGQDEKGAMLQAIAKVDGNTVAQCMLMLAVVDRKQFRSKYSPVYR